MPGAITGPGQRAPRRHRTPRRPGRESHGSATCSEDGRPGRGVGRAAELPGAVRALAAEHPDVPLYRRNLVSDSRVGGLLEATGDLAGALAEQRRCQELIRALAAEHPDVPLYRRELAVSHSRVGGLLEATGDLAGALGEQRQVPGAGAGPGRRAPRRTLIPPRPGRQPQPGRQLPHHGRETRRGPGRARAGPLAFEALAGLARTSPCLSRCPRRCAELRRWRTPRPGPGRRGPRPPCPGRRTRRRAGLVVPKVPDYRAASPTGCGGSPGSSGCRRRRRGRRRCPPGRRAARGAARGRDASQSFGWPAPGRRCRPPPGATARGRRPPRRPGWPTGRWTTSDGPPRRAIATRPCTATSRGGPPPRPRGLPAAAPRPGLPGRPVRRGTLRNTGRGPRSLRDPPRKAAVVPDASRTPRGEPVAIPGRFGPATRP